METIKRATKVTVLTLLLSVIGQYLSAAPTCSDLLEQTLIRQIPYEEIEEIHSIAPQPSAPQYNVYEGHYHGRRVFIKPGSPADILVEAQQYILVNSIGLGPKFLGLSGSRLITEWVQQEMLLHFFVLQSFTPETKMMTDLIEKQLADFSVQDLLNIRDDIRAASAKLTSHHIEAFDLQFIVTPSKRAVLVDPQKFKLSNDQQKVEKTNDLFTQGFIHLIDKIIKLKGVGRI